MSQWVRSREMTSTEYENQRIARINRNKRILKSLDLESALYALRSNGADANGGSSSSRPPKKEEERLQITPQFHHRPRSARISAQTEDPDDGQPKKGNVRGFTRKKNIWSREDEPLIQMELNKCGQPVGKASKEFAGVVGSLVRTKGFPLSHDDWRDVSADAKQKIIEALEADEELLACCDKRVLVQDWKWQIKFWRSPKSKVFHESKLVIQFELVL